MIKADTITEYLLLKQQSKRLAKQLAELKAREATLASSMLDALKGRERVESASAYKLLIRTFEKPYSPSYKTCAIELSSEEKVLAWVNATNPHAPGEELVIELKATSAATAK